jgi:nucleoside-diphosphate-sugar epimerase
MTTVLVVGGTGPSGFAIVERLLARGDDVTILHTGRHELAFSGPVEHLHCDTRSLEEIRQVIGSRFFDGVISTSGLLAQVATAMSGRTDKLVAVTGLPAYVGWRTPRGEAGLPMPLREWDSPTREVGDRPGDALTARVRENERLVLQAAADGAFRVSIIRYTMVYGPHAYIPFEWYVVRRILDGRRQMALEADGIMLPQRGYADNLAAAVLLLLDTTSSDGRAFNGGDEQVLSVRAITQAIAEELGHDLELVGIPLAASPCRNPMTLRQNTLFDLSELRALGYRDVLPVTEATRLTARWLADNPVARGSEEEATLGAAAFDYACEDRVIARYRQALEDVGDLG